MATSSHRRDGHAQDEIAFTESEDRGYGFREFWDQWGRPILAPLASLKLTVVLFALAIGLILLGTLAQDDLDMWVVLRDVFRTWFSWIEFKVFAPSSFFPGVNKENISGGFYYPGGKTIGLLMLTNLLAAHAVRFKIQARGSRLWVGLGVIAVGCVVTWVVIQSGFSKNEIHEPAVAWSALWTVFKWCLVALWGLAAYGTVYCFLRLPRTRVIERWALSIGSTLLSGLLGYVLLEGEAAQLEDPSMRILWQLTKATIAGGVLLAGCWLVFKKRAGVVLLHGGIALLMISEVIVATMVNETRFILSEGQITNYGMDIREVELAVISSDEDDQKYENVVAIPESRLVSKERIQHDDLPFDVQLVQFYENSALKRRQPDKIDETVVGAGKFIKVEGVRSSSGTDTDGAVDFASAYVVLSDKESGNEIGKYLVSQHLAPETVVIGGEPYDVILRFKQVSKPYIVKLYDVRRHNYLGTSTPRDYSSYIKLADDEGNVVHKNYRIWMNNPLRYNNDTFYQSNYVLDPKTGQEHTTLQVVANTSWMIPYVSCMIVAVGMLAQFTVVLLRFLRRKATVMAEAVAERPPPFRGSQQIGARDRAPEGEGRGKNGGPRHKPPKKPSMTHAPVPRQTPPDQFSMENGEKAWANHLGRFLPVIVVTVAALWVGSKLRSPQAADGEMKIHEFGKLPLVYEGREKPFDTLARTSLRVVSNKQTFNLDGEKQPAIRWLLDVIARPEIADGYRVFKVDSLDVLDQFNLEPNKGFYYSYNELLPHDKNPAQVRRYKKDLQDAITKQRSKTTLTLYERKLLELSKRINRYEALKLAFTAKPLKPVDDSEFKQNEQQARRTLQDELRKLVEKIDAMTEAPLAVFDPNQTQMVGQAMWEPQTTALASAYGDQYFNGEKFDPNPSTQFVTAILNAYVARDVDAFNRHVEKYQDFIEDNPPLINERKDGEIQLAPLSMTKLHFEAWYNHFEPFYLSMMLYVGAFVLAALAWMGWMRPLNRAAYWLIVFSLCVHTFALIGRIYISGRPPVTNLVSTGMFIGWGCVVLGLVVEAIYRLGVGNVVGSVGGAASLLVAHLLTTMVADHRGDSMAVMQAVLDTQFWLATHVICITFGYATTLIAGLLGLVYVIRGVATPSLTADNSRNLARMIYGTTCFAIFFSFVGTILGGLWADDSWGRFWGWDPKENGALIIVIWNALVLHARWDGMIKERGLAVLAVVGNIVTCWSWFGVNELGLGLHSYGFADGVLKALGIVVAFHVAVIAAGCMPKDWWWSFRENKGRAGGR